MINCSSSRTILALAVISSTLPQGGHSMYLMKEVQYSINILIMLILLLYSVYIEDPHAGPEREEAKS